MATPAENRVNIPFSPVNTPVFTAWLLKISEIYLFIYGDMNKKWRFLKTSLTLTRTQSNFKYIRRLGKPESLTDIFYSDSKRKTKVKCHLHSNKNKFIHTHNLSSKTFFPPLQRISRGNNGKTPHLLTKVNTYLFSTTQDLKYISERTELNCCFDSVHATCKYQ